MIDPPRRWAIQWRGHSGIADIARQRRHPKRTVRARPIPLAQRFDGAIGLGPVVAVDQHRRSLAQQSAGDRQANTPAGTVTAAAVRAVEQITLHVK